MSNLLEAFECIADRFFYHYEGSLTTPPCVEIVEWFLMRDPLPIRPVNLERFKRDLNNGSANSRDPQPLNNRTVHLTSPSQCYELGYSHYDDGHDDYMEDLWLAIIKYIKYWIVWWFEQKKEWFGGKIFSLAWLNLLKWLYIYKFNPL